MRISSMTLPLAFLLALPAVAATQAPTLDKKDKATLSDSVLVLNDLASAPDKGIPQDLLAKAECILIFPSVDKGAFIIGGKSGHGVASCRQAGGAMGPLAFYSIGGASIGLQIGGQSADLVMLVMNPKGIEYLLADKFTFGAEGTATAGPVGRTANASTDAQMHAQILTWSRSQGLFVGAALDGSVMKPDKDANRRLYGKETTGKQILVDSKVGYPKSSMILVDSIRHHMAAAAAQEVAEKK
jgi:SH3 domain-containing YSC84-like protein 1